MVNEKTIKAYTEVLNRLALASALGVQYGGDRNLYTALGYPTSISYTDYYSRFKRQDIAKAIINRPIASTWSGVVAVADPDDKTDELKEAYEALDKQLKLKGKFIRADKLSSIGRYGCLLLGLSDVKSIDDMAAPIQRSKGLKLLYVTPLDEENAKIKTWDEDTASPRYGLPATYQITITTAETKSKVFVVNYERVIHITGEKVIDEIYGTPVLEPVWNRLMDLEKLVGGSAEMFWRGARPGYAGKVKDDFVAPDDFKDIVEDQMKEYEHGLRRILINEGLDLNSLAQQIADPDKHVDIQIQMISAVTGIPKRILTGSERGELASSQDKEAWDSIITQRREEYAEMQIMKPFVDKMMMLGVLPQKDAYVVEWTSLYETTDKDKVEVGRVRAEALRAYSQSPEAQMVIPPEAFYKYFLGLSDTQIDDVFTLLELQIKDDAE